MKNRSVVLIVLLAALLIAVVVWLYNKRIEKIEQEMRPVERLMNG